MLAQLESRSLKTSNQHHPVMCNEQYIRSFMNLVASTWEAIYQSMAIKYTVTVIDKSVTFEIHTSYARDVLCALSVGRPVWAKNLWHGTLYLGTKVSKQRNSKVWLVWLLYDSMWTKIVGNNSCNRDCNSRQLFQVLWKLWQSLLDGPLVRGNYNQVFFILLWIETYHVVSHVSKVFGFIEANSLINSLNQNKVKENKVCSTTNFTADPLIHNLEP